MWDHSSKRKVIDEKVKKRPRHILRVHERYSESTARMGYILILSFWLECSNTGWEGVKAA